MAPPPGNNLTEAEEEVARILVQLPELILGNNRCRSDVSLSWGVKRKRTLLPDPPPPPPLTGGGGGEQPNNGATVAVSSPGSSLFFPPSGSEETAADPKAAPATKSSSPSLPPKPVKKVKRESIKEQRQTLSSISAERQVLKRRLEESKGRNQMLKAINQCLTTRVKLLMKMTPAGDGKTPPQPPQERVHSVVPVRPTAQRPPVLAYHAASKQWLSEHTAGSTDPPFSNGPRPPADPKTATADPEYHVGCSAAAAAAAAERSWVVPGPDLRLGLGLGLGTQQRAAEARKRRMEFRRRKNIPCLLDGQSSHNQHN